jgi:hypothetical protein
MGAEIDRLHVSPGPEIPEVNVKAIPAREQVLRHDPVLELGRQPPLARQQKNAPAYRLPRRKEGFIV